MRQFWHMADDLIDQAFQVDTLKIDQLLADWRWLCPEPLSLLARNAFGDLFLLNSEGAVLWLEVATGKLSEIATSRSQFLDLLKHDETRETLLAEADTRAAAQQGLQPSVTQCIGFKIPVVFSESKEVSDNAYVADLYERLSFLGDLHRQIANFPDGTKMKLQIN